MNFFEFLLSAGFIRAFAWTLFNSIWQGALIGFVALGLMIIFRKHRPVVRYIILYALMILMPLFFVATFLVVYHPVNAVSTAKVATSVIYPTLDKTTDSIKPENAGSSQQWYSYPANIVENQAKWFVLLWLAGFFIFLLRFSGSLLYVHRLKYHQLYPVDEQWNSRLQKLSGRLGLKRPVQIFESALARIPMTIGYLKPVVLLPLGTLSGVPPQQIDAIFLHELAHIMRKDYLLNIIQSVIELLFFYHPVTWWISGLIRQEREHICDDIVIGVNQDHINYIKALTTMEERNVKSPLLASAMGSSRKKLLFRVKRLLYPVKFRKGPGEVIIAFILLVGLLFALSLNALSVIPGTYDLTGRESGENHFNLLPYNPNELVEAISQAAVNQPAQAIKAVSEIPDTLVATSKSGNVKISVYTDSTTQAQQEALDHMAEAIDRQDKQHERAVKEYQIQVEKLNNDRDRCEDQRKVIVISKSDSANWKGDSVVVIINNDTMPFEGSHYEFRNRHGIPLPPEPPDMNYFYSYPVLPGGEDFRIKVYSYDNDSIDTLVFINPEENFNWQNMEELGINEEEIQKMLQEQEKAMKEYQLSDEQMEEHMKQMQIEIEKGLPGGAMENHEFYYNEPVVPPYPPEIGFSPEHQVAPAEKIIRQELRDDGLTERGRKYVVEVNSRAMYINGEKQPKEICQKYKKLVQGLDVSTLEGDDSFKLIF